MTSIVISDLMPDVQRDQRYVTLLQTESEK